MASSSQTKSPAASPHTTLMDPSLYEAAIKGTSRVLEQNKHKLGVLVSPNNNTVLHIAVQYGNLQCVKQILYMCPTIYDKTNSKDETPLVIAARERSLDIVKDLIKHAKDEELGHGIGAAKEMLKLANKDKDTALHEAVRNRDVEMVELLTREELELSNMANNAKETPLYLAVENGYDELVSIILTNCESAAYRGPLGRTALHASAFRNFEECTKQLLNWKRSLLREADEYGWTPLHYAARSGLEKAVRQLLEDDKSLAYLTADKDDNMSALHIATIYGHADVMNLLIRECPGCWEMVNSREENILHIAIKKEQHEIMNFILKFSWRNSLINQKDNNGDTPLHLFAASDLIFLEEESLNHLAAHKNAYNKKNQTPLDVASDREPASFKFKDAVTIDLKNLGAAPGWRNILSMDKAKENFHAAAVPKDVRKASETHLIVAALIATVTFTAGLTVPGGFDDSKGLAILATKAAFQAFVITNTMAMMLSTSAIVLYFAAANFEDRSKLERKCETAQLCTLAAMIAAIIAFTTGMYAVLSHSRWLAIIQCVIGGCAVLFTYIVFSEKASEIWIKKWVWLAISLMDK